MVFTGDTLIQDTSIITTFPGGNKVDYENITLPYLKRLRKDTIVMPEHGDPFILKDTNNIWWCSILIDIQKTFETGNITLLDEYEYMEEKMFEKEPMYI